MYYIIFAERILITQIKYSCTSNQRQFKNNNLQNAETTLTGSQTTETDEKERRGVYI